MATVSLIGQGDTKANMKLVNGKTTLGRSVKDLNCPDKKVSREHAIIEVEDNGKVKLTATHVNPCFVYDDGEESQPLRKGETKVLNHGDKFSLLPNMYIYKVVINDASSTENNNNNNSSTTTAKAEKAEGDTKQENCKKEGGKKDKKASKKSAKSNKSDDEYEESEDEISDGEDEEEEEEENPSEESGEPSEVDDESDYDDRLVKKRGTTGGSRIKQNARKSTSGRGRPARKAVKPPVKEKFINDDEDDEDFASDDPEDDDDDFEPSSESDWEEERRGKKSKKRKQESDDDGSDEDWGSRKKKSSGGGSSRKKSPAKSHQSSARRQPTRAKAVARYDEDSDSDFD